MILAPYMTAIKVGLSAALLAASAAGGAYLAWSDRTDHYEKIIAEQDNKWLVAYNAAAQDALNRRDAMDKAEKEAQVQYDKDQQTIFDIDNNIAAWMQHAAFDTGCGKKRTPNGASPGKDGGPGLLPESLDGTLALVRSLDKQATDRCTQINIAAIKHNAECEAVIRNAR